MRPQALQVLACPDCFLPLAEKTRASGTLDVGTLRCGQGHEFAVAGDVPMLVRESDRPRLRAFADSYGLAWKKAGWGSPDITYLENLPFRDVTRRHTTEWKVKARSMVALLGVLDPRKPLRVFDLGCGNGWLSHQLAIRGHDVYAVDVALDDTVGLGAAGVYVRLGPPLYAIRARIRRTLDGGAGRGDLVRLRPTISMVTAVEGTRPSDGIGLIPDSDRHETAGKPSSRGLARLRRAAVR